MTITEIMDICMVRYQNGRSCKDCIYYGRRCEQFKKKHHNKKPREQMEYLEIQEQKKGVMEYGNY